MKLIPLTQGQSVKVDNRDYAWLSGFKWCAYRRSNTVARFYAVRSTSKFGIVYMHRMILGLGRGDHRESDHINGNGLDNRRNNLRICNHSENLRNLTAKKHSKTGFKGVFFYQRRPTHSPKWISEIRVNGKTTRLGSYFTSPEDAAKAYDEAAIRLHGEFAKLNFG